MTYTVAVRALCEFTARSGDLDLRFTPAPTAQEGMQGHDRVRARRGSHYETEISLAGQHQSLCVRGRADGFDPHTGQLEEIKTFRGTLDSIRPHHRALHWAQARIYGHLLCQSRALTQLHIALVYFNVGTEEESVLVESHDAASLQSFFEVQCTLFLHWAQQETKHRQARDIALGELEFPMERFRAGQRELAVAVYRCAQASTPMQSLMAQAPTGIGKTLGTIFPMLKACRPGGLDKLFYVTAKGTGHPLALQALATINQALARQPSSHTLRVLDMHARDKACEHPGKSCHGDSCPLAQGFFDKLPLARAAAIKLTGPWDAPAIRALALSHQVCPYYLSQELAQWSDVVVSDYHYYYGSSALLYAFTRDRQWKVGVLVDEAHNLVERAQRMYSVELTTSALATARAAATGARRKALDRLRRHWNAIAKQQTTDYQAYAEIPVALQNAVQSAVGAIADSLVDQPLAPNDPVLTLYWELLRFNELMEQFGSHALFDVSLTAPPRARAVRASSLSSTLSIRNVIPAPHLQLRHASAHATVLFSGTLTPADFYANMLGLPAEAGQVDIAAPFSPEQLAVRLVTEVSTRFQDRSDSLQPIADLVAGQFERQPGNYLCFFSSFEYLQQAAICLQQLHPQIPVWEQIRGMDEKDRGAFLSRFTEQGKGVGFAVLGGAFSEGVDLPGARLVGAFIATLGLPQVNPINEQIKQALNRHFGIGKGYDYTYLYPGLRKVVQAAGRVIRGESDRGVVYLIDDRFGRAKVQALLPRWWHLR